MQRQALTYHGRQVFNINRLVALHCASAMGKHLGTHQPVLAVAQELYEWLIKEETQS